MKQDARMRDLGQWVCWRHEERGGRMTKVPYTPMLPTRANIVDSTTWSTLQKARRDAQSGYHDGIGFVFIADDPFCGIDLDGCVDPDSGEVEPRAMQIVEELSSYTEYSPSGTGLHIIVKAKLPPGGNRAGKVEIYDRDRFFTVTGRQLAGTPNAPEERQEALSALHTRLFQRPEQPEQNGPSPNGYSNVESDEAAPAHRLSDSEVLRRAMSSANGERFARLWAGDRTGYASDSEADLALCSILAFWCGPDDWRIAALFSRSGLAREKWKREDYRKRTVSRALEGMTQFYAPERNGSVTLAMTHAPGADAESRKAFDAPEPLLEAPPFPIDAMPAACQPLVREAEATLCCAPELVALPMLAVLSAAIGTSRVVELKGGWREWAALFVAVVASPGAMKTPAAKIAKKPAFARQRELRRLYSDEKEDYKRETREWELQKRIAHKANETAPEEPIAPAMSRCVASDTTVEALVGILENNPRGLLVYKDELAGWVRSMDQYKGGKGSDRQSWLSFWSCDEVVVDRKSRMGEPLIVERPFVSLFGGIQPAMLAELGRGAEDGLMDRFLFAYPEPRHVRFTEDVISEEAEEAYTSLHRKLADERLLTDRDGDPNPRPLKLSPEARELFARTVDALGAEAIAPGFSKRLEGVWSKLRGHLARLSLVLAACRCAGDPARAERVEREDVAAAVRLLEYFKVHAKRVYAETVAPDPLDLLAAELWELLAEFGGRWEGSATELHQALVKREATAMPERPDELSKLVLRIGERSPLLDVARRWRRLGGRDGKSSRVLRLVAKSPENAVDAVVTVVTDRDRDNTDNANNTVSAQRHPATAERDDGDNANNANNTNPDDEVQLAVTREDATDGHSAEGTTNSIQAGEPALDETGAARPDHPTDGRTRFTL